MKQNKFRIIFFMLLIATMMSNTLSARQLLPQKQLILEKLGFVIGYEGRSRGPCWVYERLTTENFEGNAGRASFHEDDEVPEVIRAYLDDFRGSGYDRGHMAPAGDHVVTDEEMKATFVLSNMVPQHSTCNRGLWRKLEEYVRELVTNYPVVHVITGTAYLPSTDSEGNRFVTYRVIGENDVAVPTHIWKVIRCEIGEGYVEDEAYLVPNDASVKGTDVQDYRTTVEKIERVSGILFNDNY